MIDWKAFGLTMFVLTVTLFFVGLVMHEIGSQPQTDFIGCVKYGGKIINNTNLIAPTADECLYPNGTTVPIWVLTDVVN